MEDRDLLEEALQFFDLDEHFTEQKLNERFHELAVKYHPDKGEYSSTEIFCRIMEYRQVLKEYSQGKPQPSAENDYDLYRLAKKVEREALETYFEQTRGNTIWIDAKDNPPLRALRLELFRAIELYDRIIRIFPDSIWTQDSIASMEKISVWMR